MDFAIIYLSIAVIVSLFTFCHLRIEWQGPVELGDRLFMASLSGLVGILWWPVLFCVAFSFLFKE